jgi:DNA-binding NarL/FixJ family response regulator
MMAAGIYGEATARHARVLELAREGMSSEAIAEKLGLSLKKVRSYRSLSLAVPGTPLSDREQQVAELARQGLTNTVIGQQLGLSTRTVEVHRQRALKKLGVRNAAELATRHQSKRIDALLARIEELEAIVAALRAQLRTQEDHA